MTSARQVPLSHALHRGLNLRQLRQSSSGALSRLRPTFDIKHVCANPELYKQNCLNRNYEGQSDHPFKIVQLFKDRGKVRASAADLKQKTRKLEGDLQIVADATEATTGEARESIVARARELKQQIKVDADAENAVAHEITQLAFELPNLTSEFTPIGTEPVLLGYINEHLVPASRTSAEESEEENLEASKNHSPDPTTSQREPSEKPRRPLSHGKIGDHLQILNFTSASRASGWGFYYLQHGAALLEQALIQYAIHLCTSPPYAFVPITPPSIVYSHISSAVGYRPRDASNERQTYALKQTAKDVQGEKPEQTLAGTAEIPFAALHADSKIERETMPQAIVGPSRCFRAEAGARGEDTKGLYRVHEFTKVEMFGWTLPDLESTLDLFQTMLDVQMRFYESLGLRCRVLEMPSADLGASAMRKIDIEAYFPGRERNKKGPWGEVSSLSFCGDYQSRRLNTRFTTEVRKRGEGDERFPWTVNGTACAVPRVLAAILEVGWDREREVVRIPEVLWNWMGGVREIGPPPGAVREAQKEYGSEKVSLQGSLLDG